MQNILVFVGFELVMLLFSGSLKGFQKVHEERQAYVRAPDGGITVNEQ